MISDDMFAVISDQDECESGSHQCHSHAACLNTEGSYKCQCKAGYRGSGFTCQRTYTPNHMNVSLSVSFVDVAALMDLPYTSRSSAVRPTLQTLAPIQSSTSFSQDHFGFPVLLWPFTLPSRVNFFLMNV